MTKLFLNLDIETTGLNPNTDDILEIAWDILDEDLTSVLPEPVSFIVDHGPRWQDVFSALRAAPHVVKDMHATSGLLSDLLSEDGEHFGVIADRLESDLRAATSVRPLGFTVHLMGFSPEFDRSFLELRNAFKDVVTQGTLSYSLHHRMYNLSAVKIAYEVAGYEIPKIDNENPHRAISDIEEVAAFARLVNSNLKNGSSL